MTLIMIVIIAGMAAVLWYIVTDNRFRRAQIRIEEARSSVETALDRRFDLLTRLLETTGDFIQQKHRSFSQGIRLHPGMDAAEMTKANRQMDVMAVRIRTAAESSPGLYSNEMFTTLLRSLADAEEHLRTAGKLYNSLAAPFNSMRTAFPSCLIGRKYGEYAFFQIK